MSNTQVVLGTLAWIVRRARDPLGVRNLYRGRLELTPDDLPGIDPALRPVGSVPARPHTAAEQDGSAGCVAAE